MNSTAPDTIDLAEVARSLARGWRLIVGCVAIGGLGALLVILLGPRRFDGYASAVVRSAPELGSGMLSRLGEAGGGAAGALLGGGLTTPLETEIQVLGSASVVGAVVDSLLLQAEPREPGGLPPSAFLRALRMPSAFRKYTVHVDRQPDGWSRVTGDGVDARVAAGGEVALPTGVLALRESAPAHFTLRLYDREDAIRRTSKALSVTKAGGEVLRVSFRAADSLTAAQMPNTILGIYLARRKTSDRGVNAYRVEFLKAQLDSTAAQLAAAEVALRQFQERTGVIDAPAIGKIGLERAADLRKSAGLLQVEGGALDELLNQISSGRTSARQLAAYPSFLKSPGINELLKQLAELETERTRLLARRLETDDEVVALKRSIDNVEGQLVPLARAYASSLKKQRADVDAQLGGVMSSLSAFPAAAQSSVQLARDVLRLGQIHAGLQSQLVQARLSAVAEGGDVRPLDLALPPKKVAFPDPLLTSSLGLGVGLLTGLLLAVLAGSHGRYLVDAYAIERASGVPTLRFDPRRPLLMSGRLNTRSILLVPMGPGATTEAVANRLADAVFARGEQATVLDLTAPSPTTPVRGTGVRDLLMRLEADYALVIVRLAGLTSDATAAVLAEERPVMLVAPPGRVIRSELVEALDTLRRLDVPCMGIVLNDGAAHALAAG